MQQHALAGRLLMSHKFGKFPSISAFLESFKAAQKQEALRMAFDGPPKLAARRIKRIQQEQRGVAEVIVALVDREPDDSDQAGGKHVRLRVTVLEVLNADPDISTDLDDALETQREISVAVRIGDALGVLDEIEGLDRDAELHLRGQWITRDHAQSHGGAHVSVLHFTHHPLGFTCTPVRCYA